MQGRPMWSEDLRQESPSPQSRSGRLAWSVPLAKADTRDMDRNTGSERGWGAREERERTEQAGESTSGRAKGAGKGPRPGRAALKSR